MSDFTTFQLQYNSGTDASPIWTGNNLAYNGSSGANELRWTASGSGATGATSSTIWPGMQRPSSVEVVPVLFAFISDQSGIQIGTYDGTANHYMQLRWNWDNTGTFASIQSFTAFSDSTLTTPSPGTQPGGQSGSPIVNGQSSDTSNTSYLKANVYGFGLDAGGVQETPSSNAGGTLTATSGQAGIARPTANLWSTWQSLQGWIQYIANGGIPQAATAGSWYFVLSLYTGPNMSVGLMQPVLVCQYSYT
jgi:hypothetical protein